MFSSGVRPPAWPVPSEKIKIFLPMAPPVKQVPDSAG
jgi:hypothetical protein